ncbi:3'(2'),5'-bisphosphate nucleotidase CysQ [Thalassotalea aquiviva]|uniref:3'(2'),5'-bisphosphate nucleotidase CysQ n=1 Tax=Thalassotalea aquiviva TaxID=3242415 RepID=UPI00352B6DDB
MADLHKLLETALTAAKEAGKEIMSFYHHDQLKKFTKDDDTPVTEADLAANQVLVEHLRQATPEIPIISEESDNIALAERAQWPMYWLLDPIDGTGEFIAQSGDFAVNIALVQNGWPVIGVIHAPAHEVTYYGCKKGGAFKQDNQGTKQIKVAPYDGKRTLNVGVSRRQKLSTIANFLNERYQYQHIPLGSCSLKNCQIAEGTTDCYLRIGPTGEWDTGASQCILEEAGGTILDSELLPLTYNQRESLMNPDFISLGNPAIDWQDVIIKHKCARDY